MDTSVGGKCGGGGSGRHWKKRVGSECEYFLFLYIIQIEEIKIHSKNEDEVIISLYWFSYYLPHVYSSADLNPERIQIQYMKGNIT